MKKLLLLGIAAVALTAATPAQASLTFNGDCGVINVPNALTLPAGTVALAADYVAADDAIVPIRFELGVINGLEIGGAYHYWDVDDVASYGFNAKFRLPMQLVEG